MKFVKQFFWLVCLGAFTPGMAQTTPKALTVDDLAAWKRITRQALSDDGRHAACQSSAWVGDATVTLYKASGEEVNRFEPAGSFAFSASSRYLIVEQPPSKQLTDSLKLKKTKEDRMPMNRLAICPLSATQELIDSVKTYRIAEKADFMAYQKGRKDSTLYVRSLDGKRTFRFPAVRAFGFAPKSSRLYYVSAGDSASIAAGLYVLDPEKDAPVLVKAGTGAFRQTAFSEQGDRLAFLYCAEKDSVYKSLELWLSENDSEARKIAGRADKAFPAGWVISEYAPVTFSENGSRLFFGTAPEPRQPDTTLLAEYRPDVQVWSWDEPVQYTVQAYEKKNEMKRSYQAVYNLGSKQTVQLADTTLPDIQLGDKGNAPLALLSTSRPYSVSSMWEGRTRSDYYTVSLETGQRALLQQAVYNQYRLSPGGTYAYGYAETDSSWYTLSLADGKIYRLTTPRTFAAWEEENDVPDYPAPHGAAGWTKEDRYLLLYDRYDIWKFDPRGAADPVNLTVDGRKEKRSYHLLRLDKEARFVDLQQPQYLQAFDETTKGSGYYRSQFTHPAPPKALLAGNFKLQPPLKAKNADVVLYTSETFEQYPDVRMADLGFRHSVRLTDGYLQQEGFLWGTAEPVTWLSLDGLPLEGIVYKPANFDPKKKYPLLVNFYERNAETLYSYHMPEPHRSTIDYHFYNSNEYIIFNPDVRYTDGYPGESCFNCVMPGITALIAQGYIDEKAIGAQGHSWGGYQVAYLATRTHLFAAIESGAPVVNMFSAYGGIRWGSGLNRSFQYEHGQSRIGGTPWSAPLEYLENSPLFTMNKVTTPILIMHNDADGHVPWYQGIEYFIALKRLQKPCWLLNYTGEPHWPMRMANRIDFQKRMSQFFNHYLKKQPTPKWMSEGVPATAQPFELGYE